MMDCQTIYEFKLCFKIFRYLRITVSCLPASELPEIASDSLFRHDSLHIMCLVSCLADKKIQIKREFF